VVILQGSEDEIEDWLRRHDARNLVSTVMDADWNSTLSITFDDGSDVYICAVKPMDLATVCHELSHATLKVLKIVGIDPAEAEEAYAYLFEYLISRVTASDGVPSLLSKDVS